MRPPLALVLLTGLATATLPLPAAAATSCCADQIMRIDDAEHKTCLPTTTVPNEYALSESCAIAKLSATINECYDGVNGWTCSVHFVGEITYVGPGICAHFSTIAGDTPRCWDPLDALRYVPVESDKVYEFIRHDGEIRSEGATLTVHLLAASRPIEIDEWDMGVHLPARPMDASGSGTCQVGASVALPHVAIMVEATPVGVSETVTVGAPMQASGGREEQVSYRSLDAC